ncbi:hypothetical protein H6P81_013588 [Aristolochia fimbriata]|uniref:Uncharacterized protein n=1 Tax=Aristolochia fimbriata TaxID=158543 RepID=A0AAV7EHA7_ARIFI|nr:hypothetical protein H6P81_013588 [Aristolochia fimbriata]
MEIAKKGEESAQAKLWKFVYGYADSLVIRSTIDLRLADIIHSHGGGPISLSDLSSRLPLPSVDSDRLRHLMRYLVHMGLFTLLHHPDKEEEEEQEERYGLSPLAADYLVTSSDKSIVPELLLNTDVDIMAAYHHIKDGLQPGGPTAFEAARGKNLWDYLAERPEKNRIFNEAMAHSLRLLISAVVRDCADVFAGVGSLVDVGGGTGSAARAIAKAFPDIKCTVFDLPHVIAHDDHSSEYNTTIINRVGGDMFQSIPSADAILLERVLHNWADEECVKILKNCKEAVPAQGGKVIIVDIVLSVDKDEPDDHKTMALDLGMVVFTTGKQRTEAEWKKLIHNAGFKGYEIKHIAAAQSVIVAYPHD